MNVRVNAFLEFWGSVGERPAAEINAMAVKLPEQVLKAIREGDCLTEPVIKSLLDKWLIIRRSPNLYMRRGHDRFRTLIPVFRFGKLPEVFAFMEVLMMCTLLERESSKDCAFSLSEMMRLLRAGPRACLDFKTYLVSLVPLLDIYDCSLKVDTGYVCLWMDPMNGGPCGRSIGELTEITDSVAIKAMVDPHVNTSGTMRAHEATNPVYSATNPVYSATPGTAPPRANDQEAEPNADNKTPDSYSAYQKNAGMDSYYMYQLIRQCKVPTSAEALLNAGMDSYYVYQLIVQCHFAPTSAEALLKAGMDSYYVNLL